MDTLRMGEKVIINIPVFGKPYIVKGLKDELEDIQKVVGGYIELLNKKYIRTHPMFKRADKRWEMCEKLMKGNCKVYVNENGRRTECPNMALGFPFFNEDGKVGGVNNLFGNVAIVVLFDYIKNKNYHIGENAFKVKELNEESDSESEEED